MIKIILCSDRTELSEQYKTELESFCRQNKMPADIEVQCDSERLQCNRLHEQIMFRYKGERKYITCSSISHFEVHNRIVTVYYGGGESFDFYARLDDLEVQLERRGFVRTHRSYLVNLREVVCSTRNSVEMTTGEVLPVGRTYCGRLMEALEETLSKDSIA